jgi:hypothetical protein
MGKETPFSRVEVAPVVEEEISIATFNDFKKGVVWSDPGAAIGLDLPNRGHDDDAPNQKKI